MKVAFMLVILSKKWRSFLIWGLRKPGFFLKSAKIVNVLHLRRIRGSHNRNRKVLDKMINLVCFCNMEKVPLLAIKL